MPARILIVDDEPTIVQTLAELLSWEGHEVSTAANGVEALEALASSVPDVVLLDLMMPRKDGLRTLLEMKATPSLAGVAVILMTAAPMALPAKRAPYDFLLVKPFTVPALKAALAEVLARTPRP